MSPGLPIPAGYVAVDAKGNTYPAGSVLVVERALVDVTDEYGTFGPPDTYRKHRPGLASITIDGEWVPGPVEVRPV